MTQRKEINWVMKSPEGIKYDVCVSRWAGKFRFQYRAKGQDRWDYDRTPTRDDWETLLDALERRYSRKLATEEEIEQVKKTLREWPA